MVLISAINISAPILFHARHWNGGKVFISIFDLAVINSMILFFNVNPEYAK